MIYLFIHLHVEMMCKGGDVTGSVSGRFGGDERIHLIREWFFFLMRRMLYFMTIVYI